MKRFTIFLAALCTAVISNAQNVGIGTTTPQSKLHINGSVKIDSNYFLEMGAGLTKHADAGKIGYQLFTDALDIVGAGTEDDNRKIVLFSEGGLSGGSLSNANGFASIGIGENVTSSGYTAAGFGRNTVVSGDYSFAAGDGSTANGNSAAAFGSSVASGDGSTAMGILSTAAGNASTAMGDDAQALGQASTAMGNVTKATGFTSVAMGYFSKSKSYGGLVIGHFNDSTNAASSTAIDPLNRLFQIGNGTADNARSNAMTVLQNGNVGIGTTTPARAKLEIDGFNTNASGVHGYLNATGTAFSQPTVNNSYSIWASHHIAAAQFDAFSDRRIKKNIVTASGVEDLKAIRQLRIADYGFVDEIQKGNRRVKGIIAQELATVMPAAVSKTGEFVPDIYCLSEKTEYHVTEKKLTISLCKPHQLRTGDRVRIMAGDAIYEQAVSATGDEKTFTLDDINAAQAGMNPFQQVFVYGKWVNDFNTVDYNQVFSAGISALQELARQNEEIQNDNHALQQQLDALKKEIEKIKKGMK
jgi:hypothetical protein